MTAPAQQSTAEPATPAPPPAAAEFYTNGALITAAAILAIRSLWPTFNPLNIDRSFATLLAPLVSIFGAAQVAAARTAVPYVPAVLEEVGIAGAAQGTLRPVAFIGSSSGVTLPEMLDSARLSALSAAKAGGGASAVALRLLEGMAQTQIADAARQAASVEIAVRPRVKGYVRMLNPPSCARCVVLAGRFYKWNAGFERHPRCDCRHIPVDEDTADDFRTDPKLYFESLTGAEQDRIFTAAGAQAVRDGGDINRVVNARRGVTVAQVGTERFKATTEGTGRGRNRRPLRLLPETIYKIADGDRDEAIRLLRSNGYIN